MEFRTFQKQWGAEFISDDVVRFRVWAEGQKELTLRLAATDVPMTAVGHGWNSGHFKSSGVLSLFPMMWYVFASGQKDRKNLRYVWPPPTCR